MPVPVPRPSKPCAHPVLKPHNRILPQTHQDKITVSIPSTPSSPSLGPGENWHPAWGQTFRSSYDKVSIYPPPVQGFFPGLTVFGDAAVIKGVHAEAYIPPIHNLIQDHNVSAAVHGFVACSGTRDLNLNPGFIGSDQAPSGLQHLWNAGQGTNEGSHPITWKQHASQLTFHGDPCFTPILEDHSPGSASGPDAGSSPLEPLTPFTDFVDRAVGPTQPGAQPGEFDLYAVSRDQQVAQEIPHIPTFPSIADVPKQQEHVTTTSPTATIGYKKLIEPLSEWIANYIWRVCTTGYSLSPTFKQTSSNAPRYASETPSHLAPCIQSTLLATLLQPSAIYLSLWYMVRLPVYFGAAPLGAEFTKAAAFQAAFLGDCQTSHEREHNAPLRLIVLGFMLANKWLDDHTFSNKTWHTISSIPVQTLNALESRALDTFSYDLSISNQEWTQWLGQVMAHHISLMSPGRPQPISRPSSNPHTIVRRAIEEIMQTPLAPVSTAGVPRPVFLGFEERLREKEAAMAVDVLEIDLDEDGPLREEYLPKRRTSKITSQPTCPVVNAVDSVPVTLLPPPAKWSPSGDEPIHRARTRSSGQYVAVQAPQLPSAVPAYPLQTHDGAYNQSWLHGASFVPVKQIAYAYEIPTFFRSGQPTYNSNTSMVPPHLRSQSLSYDQENVALHSHMRSYSQSGFVYRFDDIHMAVSDHPIPITEMNARWAERPHYPYSGPAFLPLPAVGLQPSW